MLDNELAGTVVNDSADTDTTPAVSPPAPRRSRRAAGRPAGPPVADAEPASSAPADAASDAGVIDAPVTASVPVKKSGAKKAPDKKAPDKKASAKKASAKKAPKAAAEESAENESVPAAEPAAGDGAAAEESGAPASRVRSRRATQKAPETAVMARADETAGADPEPTDDDADLEADLDVDVPAATATMVLFRPPVEAPVRRSRRATRDTGEPSAVENELVDADRGDEASPSRSRSRRRPAANTVDDADVDLIDADPEDIADPEGDSDAGDDGDGSGPARRRRRRGGRGRRGRGGRGGDDGAEGSDDHDEDEAGEQDDAAAETADSDDSSEGASGAGGTRRRRRRRRSGEDGDGSDDTGAGGATVVTRVRAPRPERAERNSDRSSDGVTSVRGSTRLEAKKQRRREGREAGRSRTPIVTEAEFLARREAVDRVMVVRQNTDRTQIAVLEDGVLVEHYVNKRESSSLMGDVFLGRVQNVLPSMEAAFVDIGKGRNAVLYAGEVNFDGLEGQPKRIEHALKSGQSVLVQVTKDPIGHKGARLTSQISLPGRYLVYVPEGSMTGISRKLPDTERSRLKSILRKVVPENAGVIIRTAAEGASEEEISRDVERLAAQWESIAKKAKTATAPALLQGEPDLTTRVVRDMFNEDFGSLVVDGDTAWSEISGYVQAVAPDLMPRVSRWTGEGDVFSAHRIDEQILKGLDRKVYLPSGGSLVIDRTEAMTVVDVNTGKFTGQGGNLEETVTRNNLEAAEEIVRQLRLRDIGGIIVVDFIDMVLENNRELVLRRLVECLGRDRTKHQVAEVTSLGLVQMTRKKVGQGLLEAFSETCEHCNGRGIHVRTDEPRQSIPKPGPGKPAAAGENGKPGALTDDGEGPRAGRSRRRRGARGGGEPGEAVITDVDVVADAELVTDDPLEVPLEDIEALDLADDTERSGSGGLVLDQIDDLELEPSAPAPPTVPTVLASPDDPDAAGEGDEATAKPARKRSRRASAPAQAPV
ncbi:MAG: Rne/Rng family ribonuclease [Sporichthyaceae bacterium]